MWCHVSWQVPRRLLGLQDTCAAHLPATAVRPGNAEWVNAHRLAMWQFMGGHYAMCCCWPQMSSDVAVCMQCSVALYWNNGAMKPKHQPPPGPFVRKWVGGCLCVAVTLILKRLNLTAEHIHLPPHFKLPTGASGTSTAACLSCKSDHTSKHHKNTTGGPGSARHMELR